MTIIIANAISFIAAFIQVGTGAIKKKSRILIAQTIQLMMQGVSLVLTGGITGAISNVLSCFRNFLCYKEKLNKWWKVIIILLYISMTIVFNSQGWLGILPAVVCTIYILLMNIKDPIKFKLLVTMSFIPWIFYNFALQLYVAGIVDTITVIANIVTLCIMIKEKRKKEE